jgi:hypothetical protein
MWPPNRREVCRCALDHYLRIGDRLRAGAALREAGGLERVLIRLQEDERTQCCAAAIAFKSICSVSALAARAAIALSSALMAAIN